jgi:hypothetical protein
MFGDKELLDRLDKQHAQIDELIFVNKSLIKLLETQTKDWHILADRVTRLDDPNKAAFGVVRR